MPPKAAAAVTVDALHEAEARILGNDNPSEADFKIILSGSKSGSEAKKTSAVFISRHFEKFPKLHKQCIASMVELAKSDEADVRDKAIREIYRLINVDKTEVTKILVGALATNDLNLNKVVSVKVVEFLEADEEFKDVFIKLISSQSAEVQSVMVDLVREKIKFTEETIPKLIEVVNTAFQTCVTEGLRLFGFNKKLITDEQAAPLIDSLLTRLNKSLDANFEESVSSFLVPLFRFTRNLGDDATTRILSIIGDKVMPKIDTLSMDNKIAIIQKVADIAQFVEGDKIITDLYNLIFLKFQTSGNVDFKIVEATLWAFVKLANKSSRAASKLIGTTLIYTGQPGEGDDDADDEEKKKAFRDRIEYFAKVSPEFVKHVSEVIKNLKTEKPEKEEEKKELASKIKVEQTKLRTGNNVQHLCRILLGSDPLHANLPAAPAWHPINAVMNKKRKNEKGSKQNKQNNNKQNNDNNKKGRNDNRKGGNNDNRRGNDNNNRGRFDKKGKGNSFNDDNKRRGQNKH